MATTHHRRLCLPDAEFHLIDSGHFALEDRAERHEPPRTPPERGALTGRGFRA